MTEDPHIINDDFVDDAANDHVLDNPVTVDYLAIFHGQVTVDAENFDIARDKVRAMSVRELAEKARSNKLFHLNLRCLKNHKTGVSEPFDPATPAAFPSIPLDAFPLSLWPLEDAPDEVKRAVRERLALKEIEGKYVTPKWVIYEPRFDHEDTSPRLVIARALKRAYLHAWEWKQGSLTIID